MLMRHRCVRPKYFVHDSLPGNVGGHVLRRLETRWWRDVAKTTDGPAKARLYACMYSCLFFRLPPTHLVLGQTETQLGRTDEGNILIP